MFPVLTCIDSSILACYHSLCNSVFCYFIKFKWNWILKSTLFILADLVSRLSQFLPTFLQLVPGVLQLIVLGFQRRLRHVENATQLFHLLDLLVHHFLLLYNRQTTNPHLSINTSPVNRHITCQLTPQLSINTSPVNQHITCQSTRYLRHLSINTSPANQHLTCHLPIDTSPVNRHITCQSTHHLPINTSPVNRHITCLSPVNQHVTCQSTRHLSIDTSPVTSQSTRHLSINTPTRHLSIDTSPVTSQSTHHLSIDTSPVTSQSTRHLSIDMSTRHLSSVNQHVPWNCSVFGQKVGLPSSDNLLEVWRARLQRRSCKVVEQLATARLHSRQHRHLQAETENLNFILHILWSITLNCFYVMFYVLYNL